MMVTLFWSLIILFDDYHDHHRHTRKNHVEERIMKRVDHAGR